MYKVLFYEDERGESPTDIFLNEMQLKVRAKAAKWIEKLEKEGPNLPRPYADIVKGKIRELRIHFGSYNYRFLYFFFGRKIIITHGFIKKSNAVPLGEFEKAERMMTIFLQRNKGGGN